MKKFDEKNVAENPLYHDTWKLLKKYRDVVWSLELSVQHVRTKFEIEYGTSIEDFLDSVYLAGADLAGSDIEHHAKCIERSHKMLKLLDSAVDLLRTKHKNGEAYYWLLYYSFLSPQQLKNVEDTGSVTTDNGRHVIHCLTIIGQIEGHYALPADNKTTKYEHVIPQLVAIEESREIEGLLILLNTVGGDIEAGLALAELIAGMKKPTVSLVLGGGHSIGVPLAVAAKKSFIAPSATMTLHPVRTNGLVLGVPQAFYYFQRVIRSCIRWK